MICCENKIVCCGNKIYFLWEQNNKLWEQDIILREQDKKKLSHGLNLPPYNCYLDSRKGILYNPCPKLCSGFYHCSRLSFYLSTIHLRHHLYIYISISYSASAKPYKSDFYF